MFRFDFDKYVLESGNGTQVIEIQPGIKIFCEGQIAALKIEEGLNRRGIETQTNCNEAGIWSVFIVSVPCGDQRRTIYDGCGLINSDLLDR